MFSVSYFLLYPISLSIKPLEEETFKSSPSQPEMYALWGNDALSTESGLFCLFSFFCLASVICSSASFWVVYYYILTPIEI